MNIEDQSPSSLRSYLIWRELSSKGKLHDDLKEIGYIFPQQWFVLKNALSMDVCPFCNGWKEVEDKSYGRIYCICQSLEWAWDMWTKGSKYMESIHPTKVTVIDRMLPTRGTQEQKENLALAISYSRKYMSSPNGWAVFSGDNGTGKTTMIKAMAASLYPIAFFISASKFEGLVHSSLGNNTYSEFIDTITRVPFLFFDDLGMEFGEKWMHSNLSKMVNARYESYEEHPTIFTTNMSWSQFKAYNRRVGSRLLDKDVVTQVPIIGPDYRVPA